jgi:hypothetical protein
MNCTPFTPVEVSCQDVFADDASDEAKRNADGHSKQKDWDWTTNSSPLSK